MRCDYIYQIQFETINKRNANRLFVYYKNKLAADDAEEYRVGGISNKLGQHCG